MTNSDMTMAIIGLLLTINMILCWALGAQHVSHKQRDEELTTLLQRNPGKSRSGVVIRFPRVNYDDSQEDKA